MLDDGIANIPKVSFMGEAMTRQTMNVLVIGGGTMGADIATSFAAAGWETHVMSPSLKTREALAGRMRAGLVKLEADPACADTTKVYAGLDDVLWKDLDLVVEAITEDMALKQRVFLEIERLSRPDTILTTNTSTFRVGAIAEVLKPETRKRTAGLHYFMPAHLVPLVEIVQSEWTDVTVCDNLEQWIRTARKAPVRVNKDIIGFIGNRLQAALLREALYLVESGATTADGIDTAVRFGFGFRFLACGPMKQREFAGWDGHLRSGNVLYAALCNDKQHGKMLHEMNRQGRLGMKTKEGFWKYTDDQITAEKTAYEKKLRAALEILKPDLIG